MTPQMVKLSVLADSLFTASKMRLLKIALVCSVALVVLTIAVVLLLPHSRAAAKGYFDSAWDCYHGERLLRLSSFRDAVYVEGSEGLLLYWEGIRWEYHSYPTSSSYATYCRAYTRMTRFVLSRTYGYDVVGELATLHRQGGITVRVSH